MKRIFILTVLICCITAGIVLAENIIKGPGPDECPTSDKCGSCHANNNIYDELIQSSHQDLSCFDCHLPGTVQKSKYETQERSFNRLGYYIKDDEWHEAVGNDVCLQCHDNQMVEIISDNCWSCHMPITGVDKIVMLKDKTQPMSEDNIREVKEMPHRSHMFTFHQ